jgi:hypothetical protein
MSNDVPQWPAELPAHGDRYAMLQRKIKAETEDIVREIDQSASDYQEYRDLLDRMLSQSNGAQQIRDVLDGLRNERVGGSDRLAGEERYPVRGPSARIASAAIGVSCVDILIERGSRDVWKAISAILQADDAIYWAFRLRLKNELLIRPGLQASFFSLVDGLVDAAVETPWLRSLRGDQELFKAAVDQWREKPELLDIWFGNRSVSSVHYESAEWDILSYIFEIDVAVFVAFLSRFTEPFSISAILETAQVERRFDRWQAVMMKAPLAFDNAGRWNCSVIVPLLLASAHRALTETRYRYRADATSNSNAASNSLLDAIANVISTREDAYGIKLHWSAWLMRSTMSRQSRTDDNPASVANDVEITLIKKLALSRDLIPAVDALDPWEQWCVLAAATLSTLDRRLVTSEWKGFASQWALSPEDWSGERGKELVERASLFVTFGPDIGAFSSERIGALLASEAEADQRWHEFWETLDTLREVVEFGDASEGEFVGSNSRANAGELLRLAFSVGLSAFDLLISEQIVDEPEAGKGLDALFRSLVAAARELALIDRFGLEFWWNATVHLAIRRSYFAAGEHYADNDASCFRFAEDHHPDLTDFFEWVSGDDIRVARLAYLLKANGTSEAAIIEAMDAADIDLQQVVALCVRIGEIDRKRGKVAPEIIEFVRKLSQAQDEAVAGIKG